MRISLFLLFVCVFQLMATDTEAQNAVINIRQNSLSIKQLIKEIEKQTDYLVVFRNQDVDVSKVVSFQQRFGTVSDYLNQVCENMGLGYVFENNYITLSPKVNAVNQDKKKITGKVTDQNGEAVIGASVVEKGTTNGIMTDIDGNFTLEVGDAAVVQISYIGYRTKEVSVTGKNHFLVQLLEDMQALDEVVVVGFGTQKKVNLTGAVSMVDSEVLESRPVQNVSQALQGVVPGLNFSVNKTGGELNNNLEMDIRGGGTIGEGSKSAPLVLIDGIEGDMNSINPNDIKSISVLKDASSSAIYGSRAAFGVVLITTKEGKAGRTNVNYSTNVRFSTPSALPTMMDSYQFAQFFNRAAMNQGGSPVFDETTMQRIIDYQAGKITSGSQVRPDGYYSENVLANANTDWFDKMYKKAVPSHEHNLSVSGGSDKITYLVSGSFMKQNGFINYNSDDFKRYTLNARIKADLSKYVTLVYGSKWIREDYDKPSYLGDLFYDSIARTWPTCPEYHDNGNYGSTMVYRLLYAGRNIDQKDQTYNQLQLTIEPIKDWKIYAEGNMRTINRMNHSELLPIPWINAAGEMAYGSLDGSRAAGATEVTEQSWRDNYLTGNLYSDYFKQFESGHYFKVMAGFNAELMKSRDVKGIMDNLITPDLPTLNTATENPRTSGGYSHWSTVGFFGRLNYNFQEKYLFEFNLRHDGTSRFLGDQRWGTFPSFSLGWNVAREGFFENLGNLKEYISTLKFRGSWGQLGNTNTEDLYPFYLTVPFKTQAGGWLIDGKKSNLSYAPGLVSTMLTWETVESWNVGLDWGAFNNRLTGSFEYYVRQTKDMVGPAPELPSILGTGVPKMNNADMKSYGFDLDVSWRDKVGDFSYGVKFVLSDNKRKVTRYPNENGIYSQWYAGKMSGELWGYETIGIAKTQEEMDKHLASLPNGGQTIGSQWAAGDIMYKDLNNDGKIDAGSSTLGDPGDKKIIGNSTPRYRFGLTLDGSWKGFDLSLFFQGVAKRDYLLAGPYFWGAKNGQWHSVGFDYHWDFFRPEGDPLGANVDSYYPRPLFDQGGKNQQDQTRYLQNAAYLRLKNLQLGYTFPKAWVNKIGLQHLRLYFSGDNLFTVTGLHGYYDPEALGDTGDKMGKVYPLSRTYSVGMNINF
ncbi:TonB-dependent receptor [Parabacteroides goldsteinii]|uniref:TonB-dependent receptor n=1 Tax=Parabacteroides goldsteinii TaxID=328812 RepID=UPI0021653221|nr:TonB-dependent receptor [Parabacteroides goldsteinii]MCS2427748.1 TonB-dependent receptor [Parabacteroides goldsteinii]